MRSPGSPVGAAPGGRFVISEVDSSLSAAAETGISEVTPGVYFWDYVDLGSSAEAVFAEWLERGLPGQNAFGLIAGAAGQHPVVRGHARSFSP